MTEVKQVNKAQLDSKVTEAALVTTAARETQELQDLKDR